MKVWSHLASRLFVSHRHIQTFSFATDFYNYFQHGIDFLISDHTHVVKKIILHSNVVSVFPLRFSQFLTFSTAWDTPLSTIQALSMADRR